MVGKDTSNIAKVGTIGESGTITIKGGARGIYVGAYAQVGTIGAGGTVDITATLYGIYVAENADVTTIGKSGSTVKVSAATATEESPYCIYVAGTVETLGEKGSTVTLTSKPVDTVDGYGVYLTGSGAKITNVGGKLTVNGYPVDSGDVVYGFYVDGGATITNFGTAGSTITAQYAASSKYVYGIFINGAGSSVDNICVGTAEAPSSFTVKGRYGIVVQGTSSGVATVDLIGGPYSTITLTTYKTGISLKYAEVETIGSPNCTITINHYGTKSNTSHAIWLQYSKTTIGNGATINLNGKSYSDKYYSSGIHVVYTSTVTTIGGAGTKISTTDSSSYLSYGLYVANGSKVETLGAGCALLDLCGRYGICCNGTIGAIEDGVLARSTNTGTEYAGLYVTSTGSVAANGGDYHHASGSRDLAIVVDEGGTLTYPTPCHGLSPEGDTRTVTLNNGDQKECYYIVVAYHT